MASYSPSSRTRWRPSAFIKGNFPRPNQLSAYSEVAQTLETEQAREGSLTFCSLQP